MMGTYLIAVLLTSGKARLRVPIFSTGLSSLYRKSTDTVALPRVIR